MVEIIPAILPKNREDIEAIVRRYMDTSVQTIQIDLVDGNFASPKTWPYNSKNQYQEYKILEKEGFPGWQDIDIELDLMISDPFKDIEKLIEWGPSRIIIHASSTNAQEYITFLEKHRAIQSFIHFGIAFGVDDVVDDYEEVLKFVDFVQCMGIASIGKQGQNFDERVFNQIKNIKHISSDIPVSVDGGVDPQTAQRLIEAGVSRLVSGSFLNKSIHLEEAIKNLIGEKFN